MSISTKSYLNLTINTSRDPVNTSDFKLDKVEITQKESALLTANSAAFKNSPSVVVPNKYIQSLFSPQTTKFKISGENGNYSNHNDNDYRINPSEIIRWSNTQSEAIKLNAADFAYLKDVGVYPNNRLIIARRFPGPVKNDLSEINVAPLATLISWADEKEDFFTINYGEEWEDASASFETILNNMGEGLQMPGSDNKMGQLGTVLSKAANFVTLPGLVEGLQYKLFEELKIVDKNNGAFLVPNGDPNLIRQAKQRKTLDKKQAGSGLKCSFSITMKVEYEMKYINGVDPTITYFDVIANALSFATSNARFMFNNNLNEKGNILINDLMSGNIQDIKKQLESFLTALKNVITNLAEKLVGYINSLLDKKEKSVTAESTVSNILKNTLGAVIGKYKVALTGVLNAITGAHSTPWHITIGNPKRPIFSSGDLYTEDVKMSMGPILGYNDLPSSIKLEFTLKNARNLGAEEIYQRFNTRGGRDYYSRPSDYFTGIGSFTVSVVPDETSNQFNSTETQAQRDVRDIVRQSGNTQQVSGIDARGVNVGRSGGGQL